MPLPIIVSPTEPNPTHDIKLSDGTNSVGLILWSGGGANPRALERRPRQNGQYSPFTQSDWGGGRGVKDAADDRSRYADGKRAITRHPGTVMIGGQETYTTGHRQQEQNMPGKLTWKSLLTTNRYIAYKIAASASGNRAAIYLWVRRRGTPASTLTVELCSDNAGDPGTVLKTVTATTTNITDTLSQLYKFTFASVQAVTSATQYWVKVYTSSADSAANYWDVGTDAADTNNLTKASSDGTSWSAAAYDLYFRLVDDVDFQGGLFFTYKSQLYFVTRPVDASAPEMYMNGDRGVATGTQSKTALKDTTKTWTTNEWAGAALLIVQGANSEWKIRYRTITSNTADTLTVPAFPKAFVAGESAYVILGSNKWRVVNGHGLTVLPTDAADCGEFALFAQGDTVTARRMRERIVNAVWTRTFSEERATYALFLATYRHPTQGLMVCKVNNRDNAGRASFAQAPAALRRLQFPMLINSCEAATGWSFNANVTGTADPNEFAAGLKSIKMVCSSGFLANTVMGYYATGGIVIKGHKKLRFWIYSSGATTAAELKFRISTSATAATAVEDIAIPDLPAGEWTQVIIPFKESSAGLTDIQSVGLYRTVAGARTFYIDGIETLPGGSEVALGNDDEFITGLDIYGDPSVPWVFRTKSAGSIEGGVFNPIPLKELSQVESPYNGMGHLAHNVNLYFSFLHGLERYYRNNLDDVGPNRDEGLPAGRRGYITSMTGYVGRFFYNYDSPDGKSAIFESSSGTDHHEIYRCDTAGRRIRALFVQAIPGDIVDRLWFTEGEDIAWLPLPGETLKEDTDAAYRHTHEAVLETGWMYGGEQDAVKIFSSVKLFTENLTSARKIEWDYRKDDESAWTPAAAAFTSSPVQEMALNISAKRFKLRFRAQTDDNTETPIIRAMFVPATTRPETRWTYSLQTVFEDYPTNQRGQQDTITAASVITQLDAWMEANTILTMSSKFTPYHGRSVILEPLVLRPVQFIPDESSEKLSGTIVLLEP